jgi:hypothetical protein
MQIRQQPIKSPDLGAGESHTGQPPPGPIRSKMTEKRL